MKLIILKVILWPKEHEKNVRVIDFFPGMINIISGESGTGKSALSTIVDYCLGSDKCAIPVGLIRNLTEWFGLHLRLENTEMVIARRNPESQQSTTDLYLMEGIHIEIPREPSKNARVEDLKNRFNQIAQLPNIEISADDKSGFNTRPSFRDMAAFNFQPQHIVANPYTFFFKTDTMEHREKLRIIFPLVLRAVDAAIIMKQRELRELEKIYEKQNKEYEARVSASKSWEGEIESFFLQALALGLISRPQEQNKNWSVAKYILELQKIPEIVRELDLPDVKEGTGEEAANDLNNLINEEDGFAKEISSLTSRLSKIELLSSSVEEYGEALTKKEDRLLSSGWFEKTVSDTYECAMCGHVHEQVNPYLADLSTLAHEFKEMTNSVKSAPSKLDSEILELRSELRDRERAITKVRQKRQFIESKSREFLDQRQRIRQIYLFVGRVEQAIENYNASNNSGELKHSLELLQEQIRVLKTEVDQRKQKEKLDSIIELVSRRIAQYAEMLQLEHAGENVKLDTRELSVKFDSSSGRKDYLWEVGSGQNWVGYHIATLLSLHEYFHAGSNSPVPSFIIIDQPSQVYFPEAWPSIDAPSESKAVESKTSSDIRGVQRIFKALDEFMRKTKNEYQVIVTEHAGSITWTGLENVHVVGNWRKGQDQFLIPQEWIHEKT